MHDNDKQPLLSTEPGALAHAAEMNVTLALSNRIFTVLLCLLTLPGALLETRTAGAASLDHFAWSTVSSPQETGAQFTAVLTAYDENGNVVSNFNGNITISAEVPFTSPLVISEVDNGNTNQVEFTNPSTNLVDVSGWTVAFYDYTRWPQPAAVFTIPSGTICPPQSNFVIEANGYPPGTFPTFFIGSPLQWNLSSDPVAVSLLNRTNGLVDFFCASTAEPHLITNPAPIIPGGWFGGPVPLNSNQNYTYQRQGDFNQRQALDWIATNRSIGILNSNLSLPFAPNYTQIGILPGSVYITNGIWSGSITIDAPASNVVLHADNGSSNPGVSNPFDLVSAPTVVLSLPPQTSDLTPGVQQAAIGIPSALGMDLVFSLGSSDPAKIAVPSSVVMLAGTTTTGFSLTNFNDSITDGVQLVTITASNYLFSPGMGIITNFSAPVQLELSFPNIIQQQPGAIVGQAQLLTSVPLASTFQAELFSSDSTLLVTPYFVSIPAGQTNSAFNLSEPAGPKIFGTREVTMAAFAGPGAMASGLITLNGLSTNLMLTLPQSLVEGAGEITNATVAIAGILPTNLTVSLSSSDSSAVQVPVNVVLPAGQTSVMFPITVLSNSAASPDLSVTVSASALGFTNASATVNILDDHLGTFAISSIPLTQTANQPFVVSIMAQTLSGETLKNYNGTASLFPVGLPEGSLLPAQTSNFTDGLWSGTITLTTAATNLIITAQSGSASGQSNPFNVGPAFISTQNVSMLNATVSDLIYDPGSDRIYATIPASSVAESNTIMRLNPYTASVEAYIPMDTDPGLMALSASNEYIYTAVQNGYSVERFNLGSQLPDLEFPLSGLYVYNMIGLPNSPGSVAIAGLDIYSLLQESIYDGDIARTNLADLDLTPGLTVDGILSGGDLYLPNGEVINPNTQYPVGQFPVTGLVATGPVVPDPNSGSVFFLTQQNGQTVIYAYSMTTYTLEASQTIPGVDSVAENLVRWGTNGLAFSTTGGQLFLANFSLSPVPSAASLSVYQTAPPLASVGDNISYTINITNASTVSASDVIVSDRLPAGATFVSAQSSQGSVEDNNGILSGNLGTILPAGTATLTVTVQAQAPGVLRNLVSIITSTVNSSSAQMSSTWLTSVSESGSSSQVAQLLMSANDLIFNPVDGKLYASVSGTEGLFGNSIVAIDPLSLQPSDPIAVGSQPGALALSQDGRYLYVYLQSSASIELVDLQTGAVTFQNQLAYSLALTEMFVCSEVPTPCYSHSTIPAELRATGVFRSLLTELPACCRLEEI